MCDVCSFSTPLNLCQTHHSFFVYLALQCDSVADEAEQAAQLEDVASSTVKNTEDKAPEPADVAATSDGHEMNVSDLSLPSSTMDVDQPSVDGRDPVASTSSGELPAPSVQLTSIPAASSHGELPTDTVAQSQVVNIEIGPQVADNTDTPAGTKDSSTGLGSFGALSPVISIADDDSNGDVVVVEDTEASAGKRMKASVVSAWQGQNGGTLKSVVEKALAHVTAFRGTGSQPANTASSTSSVTIPSLSSQAAAVVAKPVAATATRTACIGNQSQTVAPEAAPPGSQSQISQRQMIGRGINTTATQADVPTARVVGRIISMHRGSSPQITSRAHRASTTPTHTAASVTLSSVSSASTTVAVTVPAQSVAPTAARAAANKPPNVSSAARNRSSASDSVTTSPSGRRPRRPRRPRHVALLRPEDLYEISSQIVAEVLARNRPPDVITCTDDDDDDDDVIAVGTVADTDASDARSQSPSSGDDVVVLDEPAVTTVQANGTQHSRAPATTGIQASGTQHSRAPAVSTAQASSTQHSRAPTVSTAQASGTQHSRAPTVSTAQASGTQHSRAPTVSTAQASGTQHSRAPATTGIQASGSTHLSRPQPAAPPASTSTSAVSSSSSWKRLAIDPPSAASSGASTTVSAPKRLLISPASWSSVSSSQHQCVGAGSSYPEDVAILRAAMSHAADDDSDDVVCCDDQDSEDTVQRATAQRTTASRVPTMRAPEDTVGDGRVRRIAPTNRAAAVGESDDVVCCDDQDSDNTVRDAAIERTAAADVVPANRVEKPATASRVPANSTPASYEVLICDDENSEETVRGGRVDGANVVPVNGAPAAEGRASASLASTNRAAVAAAADDDDDVLMCDSPARRGLSLSRRQRASKAVHSMPVVSVGSVAGSGPSNRSPASAAVSSSHPGISASPADEVIVLEANDNSSLSSSASSSNNNTQGDDRRRSPDSSVIILD